MNQKGLMDLRQGFADRDAAEHEWKKADRDKAAASEAEWKKATSAELMTFRTDGSGQPMNAAAPQQPVMMDPGFKRMPGFAQGGLVSLKRFAEGGVVQIPDEAFAGNDAAAYQVGGLAQASRPQQQQQPQQQQEIDPANMTQELTRQMLGTDLLSNPDKLNRLSAIAEAHGMGDRFKPFLERAYTAKKQGLIEGGMQLMRGQVDEAIDSLAKGGIKLEDRPTPADPNNPRMWKINISGAGEKVMDIGDLLQTTLDVDKFLKHQMDRSESEGKRSVSDAQVRNYDSSVRDNDASVRVRNAQVGKLGEETKSIREERNSGALGGRGGKLPSDAQMVEYLVEKGIVDSPAEGWRQVKTNGDKSSEAWRMSLIEANVKAGMSTAESAKDVDAFLAQSGQGSPAPKAGAVRKYNPRTGGFD
ncbi:hypothetical protein [Nitrosovibrio sp. Nv4]|uniref:hypothetical protein n=1 Tax=Nitrosovibrio sp. Nv4 TaxID=1945880 RepID=UPI00117ED8B2|nr:hypothetical protein [Nitrosovibrio sp. Nv4]